VAFSLVFLLFVVGTTWSLASSDYPWADGELTADIATIAVSALLAVLTGFRSRHFARLVRERELPDGAVSWLPDDSGVVGADVEAQTPRLRTTARRTVALTGAWGVVLLVGVGGFVLLDVTAKQLLEHGNRTAGTVVGVFNPSKGAPSMQVRYSVGATGRTAKIYRDSDRKYAPGDQVTVVYDPADSGDVRTVEESNHSRLVEGASYLFVLAGLTGILFSAFAARGWQRRYRAVRATGWRRATAHISQPHKKQAKLTVRYPDGTWLALTAAASTYAPPRVGEFPGVTVWVGGEGAHMVVLLPRGRWYAGLHPMPARAVAPRTTSPRHPGRHSR
jgi:hypothetical protein